MSLAPLQPRPSTPLRTGAPAQAWARATTTAYATAVVSVIEGDSVTLGGGWPETGKKIADMNGGIAARLFPGFGLAEENGRLPGPACPAGNPVLDGDPLLSDVNRARRSGAPTRRQSECVLYELMAQRVKMGKLYVVGPWGRRSSRVLIKYDLFGFYRIEALEYTQLAGDDRYLSPGERAWVPRHAVRLLAPERE